jgi:hypothetical protein
MRLIVASLLVLSIVACPALCHASGACCQVERPGHRHPGGDPAGAPCRTCCAGCVCGGIIRTSDGAGTLATLHLAHGLFLGWSSPVPPSHGELDHRPLPAQGPGQIMTRASCDSALGVCALLQQFHC